jgi:hypothetical protein
MNEQNVPAAKESPWFNVMLTFGRSLVTASGVRGGNEALDCAVDLIRAVEGAQQAQAEMLNAIHVDVELLRLQAFRSGQLRLEEAARIGPRSERYLTLLNEASTRFLDAEPTCNSLEERAVNELNLGLTLSLLRSPEDASYWLKASAVSGSEAARVLAEAAGNIKVLKSKKAAALAAIYYPAGIVVLLKKKKKKRQEAHVASEALADFLPFVNTAVTCHNALGLDAPMPVLELTQTGKNNWTLQEGP